jgi:hypothetical protein
VTACVISAVLVDGSSTQQLTADETYPKHQEEDEEEEKRCA